MNDVLNIDLTFNYQDLRIIIPTVGGLLGFIIYWFTWRSEHFQHYMLSKYGEDIGRANIVIFTKIFGGFTMGILPVTAYMIAFPATTFAELGFNLNPNTSIITLVWIVGLGGVMMFLVWKNARKPESLKYYPQIRAKNWTKSTMVMNIIAWVIYLLGYELLFRGILLFPLVEKIGLWPAIAINLVLYSGTHLTKGLKETVGSIPLCIIFCLVSVQVGNFWVAASVHIIMALTNELTSFKHHPDMKYI